MSSIEEILDLATPSEVQLPSVDCLRRTVRHRARKRRVAAVATTGFLALAIGLAARAGLGSDQRIESIDQAPLDDREQPPPPTTTRTPDSSQADQQPTTTRPVSSTRWFLVPGEPIEIEHVTGQSTLWEELQQAGISGPIVTDDPGDPAIAKLAWIYHLEDASIFRIGPPDWDYHETTVSGRQVRIGNEPGSDRVSAYTASEAGSFVLVGVGLADEQAIELVLSAQVVAGATELEGPLPSGFTEVPQPVNDPVEYRTEIGWQQGGVELRLSISRSTLEEQALLHRSGEARLVETRATSAVFAPTEPGVFGASLIWVEDGYVFVLSTADEEQPVDPELLTNVAESLQRTDQARLAERLGDPFMSDQSTAIAEWLAATPPPPGWDASSLVDSIPQAELTASSQVRHYLECTWIAEWAEAVRSDDQASRERAEGVLADQMSWPVFQVEIEARSRIQAQFADHIDQIDADIEDRAEQMTAARSADDVAEFERDHSCGFVKPQE